MNKSSLFLSFAASWLTIFLFLPNDFVPGTTLRGYDEKEIYRTKTSILNNGKHLPLVGVGVGNLQKDKIVSQLVESVKHGTRLIDTVHTGTNENLVRQGIMEGLASLYDNNNDNVKMHVVTKIWYTYLGYERTKIAVREILEQLNHPNIYVHVLLHYPRCRDDIPWMKCKEEEDNLPESIKKTGPPPHLDKANAFKESWRALEDIYLGEISDDDNSLAKLESIGVSNFGLDDLEALEKSGRIMPHILQDDVWNYMFNTNLVTYCEQHSIHFQAYNIMNGILNNAERSSPIALSSLTSILNSQQSISDSPSMDDKGNKNHKVGPHQVILKWLTQNNVSVIPRTASIQHIKDNSETSLASIADLTEDEIQEVKHYASVMLKQQDLEPPLATFHNKHSDTLHIFWAHNRSEGEEVEEYLVKEGLKPGEQFHTRTYPGHTFVAYDLSKKQEKVFTVRASYGRKEDFHVEL